MTQEGRDLLAAEILRLLERLAEARRRAGDLEDRLRESEEGRRALGARLEEARGLVRRSRALGPLGPLGPGAAVEVVVVGAAGGALARTLHEAGVAATLVTRPDAQTDEDVPRRIEARRDHPAHLWNVALQAAEAPAVLLLEGSAVCRLRWPEGGFTFPEDERLAGGVVAVEGEEGSTAGFRVAEDLSVRASESGTGEEGVVVPDPRAFLVRRAAYDRIGPFDEDLFGPMALVDWALRVADLGFAFAPVEDVAALASAPPGWDSGGPDAGWAERLLVAAERRPRALAPLFQRATRLEEWDGARRAAFLSSLARRLGERAGEEARFRFLLELASSWSAETVDAPSIESRLAAIEEILGGLGVLPPDDATFPTRAQQVLHRLDRIPGALEALKRRKGDAEEALASLRRSLDEQRRSFEEQVSTLREELDRMRADRDAHAERGRRAEEAAAALHEEVGRVRERVRALEEERLRLRAEVERLDALVEAAERRWREAAASALGLPPEATAEEVLARAAELRARVEVLLREVSTGLFGRRLRPEERRLLGPGGDGAR